ncbi:ArdC family protein [Sphingomonas sp. 1P08PE]|uniref:ArdC family protein n=1 Tax=Sphingomonas sp. 1P08PE TaxID=554122 RepID=UPI0039A18F4F
MSTPATRRASGKRPSSAARARASGRAGTPLVPAGAAPADRGGDGRASLYDAVTARIVAELEAGRVPWVQPWRAGGGAIGPALPRNAVTARAYSGINILILWGAVIDHGYPSHGWLTFRQAIAAGGAVRRGERGTTVVYADRFVPRGDAGAASDPLAGGKGADAGDCEGPRTIPFLKRFTVFNVAQCDGLRDLAPDPVPLDERDVVPVAEAVVAASGVGFHVGGDQAFYMPARDVVQVPPQAAFPAPINFYRTVLHELTHATGHPSRLDRRLLNAVGSKDYAREELVAEMGSAFLCAALGIVPTVRHADYIACWLDVLREDNRAIFRAASAASRAADWLLARHAEATAAAPAQPMPAVAACPPATGHAAHSVPDPARGRAAFADPDRGSCPWTC